MAEIFDKPVSNDLVASYCEVLKDEPQEALRQAAKAWIRTGKRFPLPADLIELVEHQTAINPDERSK